VRPAFRSAVEPVVVRENWSLSLESLSAAVATGIKIVIFGDSPGGGFQLNWLPSNIIP
jgi:hypothetical protein